MAFGSILHMSYIHEIQVFIQCAKLLTNYFYACYEAVLDAHACQLHNYQ